MAQKNDPNTHQVAIVNVDGRSADTAVYLDGCHVYSLDPVYYEEENLRLYAKSLSAYFHTNIEQYRIQAKAGWKWSEIEDQLYHQGKLKRPASSLKQAH